jgi:CubicO group peptidase (beta-lactamase class C family)
VTPDAALAAIDSWPVHDVAAGAIDASGVEYLRGPVERVFRFASITKVLTAWATLIAVEDGTLHLDEPAGAAEGSTLRHLLTHAGGYGFDSNEPIVSAGRKRVYSNTGYDVLASHVERAVAMPFSEYLAEAVFQPLGMTTATLQGSAARDGAGTIVDLAHFAAELRSPRLIAPVTYREVITPQFPLLDGVVPGFGSFVPCPWGLGPELHGEKRPHWMPDAASPRTFGHFGGAGGFVWVDPDASVACWSLSGREFGAWAVEAWPALGASVLQAAS